MTTQSVFAEKHTKLSYIAVLTPMKSESEAIAKYLTQKKRMTINGITYTMGEYAGRHIILTATGIGKINAAAITSALIVSFHPKAILFGGIAGKLKPQLKLGDIIVGKSLYAVEHQTITNKPSTDDINVHTNKPNPSLLFSSQKLLKIAKKIQGSGLIKEKIIFGRIATTDIYPPVKFSTQRAIDSHSIAISIEGFAVLAVGQIFNIPCIVVRGISDNSSVSLRKKYQRSQYKITLTNKQVAENNVALFLTSMIKQL